MLQAAAAVAELAAAAAAAVDARLLPDDLSSFLKRKFHLQMVCALVGVLRRRVTIFSQIVWVFLTKRSH